MGTEQVHMMKSPVGNASLLVVGLFLACLALEPARAAPVMLWQSAPIDCTDFNGSTLNRCPGTVIPVQLTEKAADEKKLASGNRARKNAAYPTLRKHTQYSIARERLLRSGWQPASTSDADQCEKGDTRCEGRPEMQACAGTGEANCLFCWQKSGSLIVVTTVYDPPVIDAVERRKYCR